MSWWRPETRPYEFLHFMSFVDAEAEQVHGSSDTVHAFTEGLYPLWLQAPTFEEWRAVREPGAKGGP